jgi:hypothetical protein
MNCDYSERSNIEYSRYRNVLTLQRGHLNITVVGPLAVVFFNYPFKFALNYIIIHNF